jgi:23S rRNA (cytidine2498-2'-O)-methyltransferase
MTEFVFATCLPRSMPYLKSELARTRPDLRLAYSRPGLITMRTDAVPPGLNIPEPQAVFARAAGRSLGLADSLDRIIELARLITTPEIRLHVFAREPLKPDEQSPDYEGIKKWKESICGRLGNRVLDGDDAKIGDTVFDIVLPPPGIIDLILVGWHIHDHWRGNEPGGVCQVPVPPGVPSRAYAKMVEALHWSALPLNEGDVVVEIGSAPGGAVMALLQRGANVIGIDPSRMDQRVLDWNGERGTFRHVSNYAERLRSRDLPSKVDWLVLDANIAPHRALVALKHLMSLRWNSIRGLLLTLKLHDEGVIEDLPMLFDKICELSGAVSLRATQLPSAHQEVVVWVQRQL